MSNFPSYNVNVAAQERNNFDLSESLVTSTNFGNTSPVYTKLLVPGDKISIDARQFTRLLPMPAPTFGQIDLQTRGFFVPLRLLWRNFDSFLDNTKDYFEEDSSYRQSSSPYCTLLYIHDLFFDTSSVGSEALKAYILDLLPTADLPSSLEYPRIDLFDKVNRSDGEVDFSNYDLGYYISVYDSTGKYLNKLAIYANFNVKGKRLFNLLSSLGFCTNFLYYSSL